MNEVVGFTGYIRLRHFQPVVKSLIKHLTIPEVIPVYDDLVFE